MVSLGLSISVLSRPGLLLPLCSERNSFTCKDGEPAGHGGGRPGVNPRAQPCFWHFVGQRALEHLLGWEREGYANCTLVAAEAAKKGEGTLLPFNGRQNLWLSCCVGLFMGTLCNKSLPVNLGNFPVCF